MNEPTVILEEPFRSLWAGRDPFVVHYYKVVVVFAHQTIRSVVHEVYHVATLLFFGNEST